MPKNTSINLNTELIYEEKVQKDTIEKMYLRIEVGKRSSF
jgi:hypothetical protein